jgi:peptidyl-prolyl cis-trans isomerase A (cyclophilin A)
MKKLSYLLLLIFSLMGFSLVAQNPIIQMETEMGIMKVEIFINKAPITAQNFLKYVNESRLDSSNFYRVVRNDNQKNNPTKIQVIQAGLFDDFHPKMLAPIQHESTKETGLQHLRGSISMARNEPGTATSEFFICLEDEPELDFGGARNPDGAGFAVFGKVIEGMNVVEQIHQSPAEGQYLKPWIRINKIELLTKAK